jgi:menaquinone-dependent protoporphyrinogen IX oxidase
VKSKMAERVHHEVVVIAMATHVSERRNQVELRDSAALASGSDLETFHAFIIAASRTTT